eukprot:748485_1
MSILMQSPFVEHYPQENGFTVSNVKFAELEVVAPDLRFQVLDAGPMEYMVAYQPTGVHFVKLKVRGKVIKCFWVTKPGVTPACAASLSDASRTLIGSPKGPGSPNDAHAVVQEGAIQQAQQALVDLEGEVNEIVDAVNNATDVDTLWNLRNNAIVLFVSEAMIGHGAL